MPPIMVRGARRRRAATVTPCPRPTHPRRARAARESHRRAVPTASSGPGAGSTRGPGRRLGGEHRRHPAGAVPAAVEPRGRPRVRVRRDLLRQGRVVAAPLRLRARGTSTDANDQILDGTTTGLWTNDPSMVVHPEVGKWLIALGEKAFGMDPFGWRISAAVVGSLMVLVMCRLVRRMTGSTALGLRRGAAAEPRRAAARAVPAGAARHLPGLLHPVRRRAAWSPTGTGTAPRWRGWCPRR